MNSSIVAILVLILGIFVFLWCRFLKRNYLNCNLPLKFLCWINWIYWMVVDLALWQDHRTVFPFSLVAGRALENNGIYIPAAFIGFFLIAYQAPFTVYMKKHR